MGLNDGEGDVESQSLSARMTAGGEEPGVGISCLQNKCISSGLLS